VKLLSVLSKGVFIALGVAGLSAGLNAGLSSEAFAAPPAKAFGELPVAYDAAISPDGERLAIIVNIRGTYAVLSKRMDGSQDKPWVLTLGDDIKPRYIKWVNNDRFVAAVRKSEEYRNTPFTTRYLFTGDVTTKKGKVSDVSAYETDLSLG